MESETTWIFLCRSSRRSASKPIRRRFGCREEFGAAGAFQLPLMGFVAKRKPHPGTGLIEWRSRSMLPSNPPYLAAPVERAGLLQLRRAWNRRPPQPLHDRHCLANTATSANSTHPAVLASQARTFHEPCNVHSPDGGFSGGTTGSILTSRTTSQDSGHSPQGVLRLNWRELLFGEAAGIMHMMRVSFQEKLLHLDAEVARNKVARCSFSGEISRCRRRESLPPCRSYSGLGRVK